MLFIEFVLLASTVLECLKMIRVLPIASLLLTLTMSRAAGELYNCVVCAFNTEGLGPLVNANLVRLTYNHGICIVS